jgi:hypothetical protein
MEKTEKILVLSGALSLLTDLSRNRGGTPLVSEFRPKIGDAAYNWLMENGMLGEKYSETLGQYCFTTDKGRVMLIFVSELFTAERPIDAIMPMLEFAINSEPTGDMRNAMTDANIMLLSAIGRETVNG